MFNATVLSLNQICREMHFSINGVNVFLPFIRVDYEGEETIGPKWLVPCSPPLLADGYEFDYNLNLHAGAVVVETHQKKRKGELRTNIDTYDNIEKLDGDDLINTTRFLKRQKRHVMV
jgi:hypothetical protein